MPGINFIVYAQQQWYGEVWSSLTSRAKTERKWMCLVKDMNTGKVFSLQKPTRTQEMLVKVQYNSGT